MDKTKVFISWSGATSKRLAELLKDWLPLIIPTIEPFVSSRSIEKGARSLKILDKELEKHQIGIFCLQGNNYKSPWINYEAGAIAKNSEESRICSILFDLKPTDITGPLVNFQNTQFSKDDMLKYVHDLAKITNSGIPESNITTLFSALWEKIDIEVANILFETSPSEDIYPRSDRELLEEVLRLSRAILKENLNDLGHKIAMIPKSIPSEMQEEINNLRLELDTIEKQIALIVKYNENFEINTIKRSLSQIQIISERIEIRLSDLFFALYDEN